MQSFRKVLLVRNDTLPSSALARYFLLLSVNASLSSGRSFDLAVFFKRSEKPASMPIELPNCSTYFPNFSSFIRLNRVRHHKRFLALDRKVNFSLPSVVLISLIRVGILNCTL